MNRSHSKIRSMQYLNLIAESRFLEKKKSSQLLNENLLLEDFKTYPGPFYPRPIGSGDMGSFADFNYSDGKRFKTGEAGSKFTVEDASGGVVTVKADNLGIRFRYYCKSNTKQTYSFKFKYGDIYDKSLWNKKCCSKVQDWNVDYWNDEDGTTNWAISGLGPLLYQDYCVNNQGGQKGTNPSGQKGTNPSGGNCKSKNPMQVVTELGLNWKETRQKWIDAKCNGTTPCILGDATTNINLRNALCKGTWDPKTGGSQGTTPGTEQKPGDQGTIPGNQQGDDKKYSEEYIAPTFGQTPKAD